MQTRRGLDIRAEFVVVFFAIAFGMLIMYNVSEECRNERITKKEERTPATIIIIDNGSVEEVSYY